MIIDHTRRFIHPLAGLVFNPVGFQVSLLPKKDLFSCWWPNHVASNNGLHDTSNIIINWVYVYIYVSSVSLIYVYLFIVIFVF